MLRHSRFDRPSWRAQLARLPCAEIAIGLAFSSAALGAIAVTHATGGVALLWPANAIAAALLIRLPKPRWISAAGALFAAGVAANLAGAHHSLAVSTAMTCLYLAEIAAMVWVYRFKYPLPYPHISLGDAAHMTFGFGILLPGMDAIGGGLLLQSAQGVPAMESMPQWWVADTVGACLFGPPIILYSQESLRRLVQRAFLAQNMATLVLCLGACDIAIRYVKFPFVVLGLPLLVAAFRVGGFGASLLSLCSGLTVIALWVMGVRPSGLVDASHASSLIGLPIIALLASLLPPTAVGLGTDARRKAARALRFSERRFRESMEHSPIGVLLMDLDGTWTYSNAALQTMLGYSHEELRAFPPGGPSNPQDLAGIEARWRTLRSSEVEYYEIDRRFLHKSGAWIWVHAAVSLVRDEDGSPLHFIAQIESLEARRRAEQHLAEERERLKITLLAITDAVITTDGNTRITYVNAAAEALLGQKLQDIAHRRWDEVASLTDPDTSKAAANLIGQSIIHGTVFRRDTACVLHRPDGSVCYVTEVVSPVTDASGLVSGVVIVLHDASADFARTRDIVQRATHDALTGLTNRFEFQRRLKQVFGRAHHVELPAALIAIDLDRFKAVNDSGGHAAGDAMLCRVAEILSAAVRQSDTVARLGGDEFAIVLENCPPNRAAGLGRHLLQALNPLRIESGTATYDSGASIGLAMLCADYGTEAAWLAAADRACYDAKRCGRGEIRVAGELPDQIVGNRKTGIG